MTFLTRICPTCQQRVHVVAGLPQTETTSLSCGHSFGPGEYINYEMTLTSPPELVKTEPEMELQALKIVNAELTAKIQHLVEVLDEKGLLEEHCYTFPDGDVWKTQDVEEKPLSIAEANEKLKG